MFKSLKGKITIPILLVMVLMSVLIIAYVSVASSNLASDMAHERVHYVYRGVVSHFEALEDYAHAVSLATSRDNVVMSSLHEWNDEINRTGNRDILIEHLRLLALELNVDSFVVRDNKGRIILRLHDLGH